MAAEPPATEAMQQAGEIAGKAATHMERLIITLHAMELHLKRGCRDESDIRHMIKKIDDAERGIHLLQDAMDVILEEILIEQTVSGFQD